MGQHGECRPVHFGFEQCAGGDLICGTDKTGGGAGNVIDTLAATLGAANVESGDSLWSIAQKIYGNSAAYRLIIEKNKDKYPNIASGLLIGQELTFDCNSENTGAVKGASDIRDNAGSNNPETQNQESLPAGGFKWWNPLSWF